MIRAVQENKHSNIMGDHYWALCYRSQMRQTVCFTFGVRSVGSACSIELCSCMYGEGGRK